MKEYEYVILGAGPSGLTAAISLIDCGVAHEDILVLEKESEVGGLCRSAIVDNGPIDIGGGHFLDERNTTACNFIFRFMPRDEWNHFKRISKINLPHGAVIDYPLEANIWQLPDSIKYEYLDSIKSSGSNLGSKMPDGFSEWVNWKFGDKIASDYMVPYNQKMWGDEINNLGTYWLDKLPQISAEQVFKSFATNSPQGTIPAHATFLYPKYGGYGEVWKRMGTFLQSSLQLNYQINSIDPSSKVINNEFKAKKIISTIPWVFWKGFCVLPNDILECCQNLKYTSIDIDYYPNTLDSDAHWIYVPDPEIKHHRLLLRNNFNNQVNGYWSETNSTRGTPSTNCYRHKNTFAYPLNTKNKLMSINKIRGWFEQYDIASIGRWGTWEHINSDIAVSNAIYYINSLSVNI